MLVTCYYYYLFYFIFLSTLGVMIKVKLSNFSLSCVYKFQVSRICCLFIIIVTVSCLYIFGVEMVRFADYAKSVVRCSRLKLLYYNCAFLVGATVHD
ncbi:hypothetical protein Hanom_Chr08g00725231 [Helianthus anomalus]